MSAEIIHLGQFSRFTRISVYGRDEDGWVVLLTPARSHYPSRVFSPLSHAEASLLAEHLRAENAPAFIEGRVQ